MPYRKFLFLFILNLFFLFFSGTGKAAGEGYVWPTSASRLMTSSFCEFRPRHFHAAIDIKTWNRTGYKVFAISDGYIMRVRVSAYGYGRAIYLKLKDGNMVIYGHLERFAPRLEKYVNRIRRRKKQYRVDLYFKPGQFPVRRGQLIAYSGKTGIGVPHLHFEIRNPRNEPINPLPFYANVVQDNKAPRFYQLAVLPLDYRSFVNLRPDTFFVDLHRQSQVVLPDTLLLSGKIGLALKLWDRANGASNRFSFYRAAMWVDDSLVYSVRYERFPYRLTREIELDKNFSLWRRGLGIFHNFFRHPANGLPCYPNTAPEGGILSDNWLSPGLHRLRIEAEDFRGNRSEFRMIFRYGTPARITHDLFRRFQDGIFTRVISEVPLQEIQAAFAGNPRGWEPDSSAKTMGELKRDGHYFYAVMLNPPAEESAPILRLRGIDASGFPGWPDFIFNGHSPTNGRQELFAVENARLNKRWIHLRVRIAGTREMEVLNKLSQQMPGFYWYAPEPGVGLVRITIPSYLKNQAFFEKLFHYRSQSFQWVVPGTRADLWSADSLFHAHFPPNALYSPAATLVQTDSVTEAVFPFDDGYRRVGHVYNLQPFDIPVNRGVRVSLTVPPARRELPKLGLFYLSQKGRWSFIPSQADSLNHRFTARVTSLEKFTLGQDTIPPQILPAQRLRRDTLYSRNGHLSFLVEDDLSGIGREDRIEVLVNGRWHLFEYDPEEDVVNIKLALTKNATQKLQISARDNLGNTTTKIYFVR